MKYVLKQDLDVIDEKAKTTIVWKKRAGNTSGIQKYYLYGNTRNNR